MAFKKSSPADTARNMGKTLMQQANKGSAKIMAGAKKPQTGTGRKK